MRPGHIVLVGLPGAGKSTAGRLVAARLGVGFVDLDEQIAAETGRPVADIIAQDGEGLFRERERDTMHRVLAGPPAVIASGGGWAAQPGNLEAVAGRGLVVHLAVTPPVAARRLGNGDGRPLLSGGPVLDRLTELHSRREKYYRRANHAIATDAKTVQEVVTAVATLARKHAGL